MVETLHCTEECTPTLGHHPACPRYHQNTAAHRAARAARGEPHPVLDAEFEVHHEPAPRALPAQSASTSAARPRSDRLFEASLRIYLQRIEKGTEPNRTMAAECVDTARLLVSEVERES